MSLLSNLDGLTPEGLEHLLGPKKDAKIRTAAYVDTSEDNSCVSIENKSTPRVSTVGP